MRTAVVRVWYNRANYQRLHDAAFENAHLWNNLVAWVREEWEEGHSPTKSDIEKYGDKVGRNFSLHSHTRQATSHAVWTAIKTSRTLRDHGFKSRAPYREKNYRPLTFSHGFGYRVTSGGKLFLSLGMDTVSRRRRDPVLIPLPEVVDARTGVLVPPNDWGAVTLCWNRNEHAWFLHIPYETRVGRVPQAVADNEGDYSEDTVLVSVDEGIINSFALTVHDRENNVVDSLVLSGRRARSVKHYRNTQVRSLDKAISRTKVGSRKHKRLSHKKKKTQARTSRQLHNLDHQVSKKAANFIREKSVDPTTSESHPVRSVVGDVRGIEQGNRQKRRARKNLRKELSQWSRGRQEKYLEEKTGLKIEYVPEHYMKQSCPKCGVRKKPAWRVFECKNPGCKLVLPRDIVGSGNIGARAYHGGTKASKDSLIVPWVDEHTRVVVLYQQPVYHRQKKPRQRTAGGVGDAVLAQNQAKYARSVLVARKNRKGTPTPRLTSRGDSTECAVEGSALSTRLETLLHQSKRGSLATPASQE